MCNKHEHLNERIEMPSETIQIQLDQLHGMMVEIKTDVRGIADSLEQTKLASQQALSDVRLESKSDLGDFKLKSQSDIDSIKSELTGLKVKSGLIGVVAGAVPTMLYILLTLII